MSIFPRLPLLFFVFVLVACDQPSQPGNSTAGQAEYLVAVNSPLQTFARRLLGGQGDVRMPASALPDPSQWQPSIDEVQLLQGAQLVLLNGASYSAWIDRVSLSDQRLVASGQSSEDRWIELTGQVTHSHGPTGEHAHGGFALTTWMDMQIAADQATAVAAALQRQWPGKVDSIKAELGLLLAEIDSLDRSYRELAAKLSGRQVIYSHPVYQYFERRYDLPGLSLHWEPDVMPSSEQWQELSDQLKPGALFVWEGEPEAAIASKLASMGVEQVNLDPGANTGGEDWLNLQLLNIERLRGVSAP